MYDKEVEDGLVILHKDNIWDNFKLMLDDIKKHPYKVEQNDNPLKLKIGYKSTVDDSVWQISIHSIKNDSEIDPLLLMSLKTAAGKDNLLAVLNKDK